MTQVLEKTVTESQILTFEEYRFYQSNDDILYELFKGKLIPLPIPSALHINICNFLLYQLRIFFVSQNMDLMAINPVGVRTEKDSSRIPDLVVCTQELWPEILKRKGAGIFDFGEIPTLVVEVTSDNWREDYIRKRAEYALVDIPEYWIINPKKQVIFVLSKPEDDHGYHSQEFKPGEEVISVQFPDFVLSADMILSPPLVQHLIKLEKLEKNQLEVEKNQLEVQKNQLEVEKNQLEVKNDQLEVQKNQLEVKNDQLENDLELQKEKSDRLLAKLRELGIEPDTI